MKNARLASRYATPAIVFAIAIVALIGIFTLNRVAEQARQIESLLLQAESTANEISANEWQMIANQQLDQDMATNMESTRRQISQLIQEAITLDPNYAESKNAQAILEKYLLALDNEIQLVKSGKISEAKTADSQQVDPLFSQLKDSLSTAVTDYGQRSNQVQAITNTGSLLLILVSSLLVGIFLFQNRQASFKTDLMNTENKALAQIAEQSKEASAYSASLDHLNTQLLLSSRIAQRIAAVREMGALLDTTVELITDELGFYHAGIYLVDEEGQYAVLQSASFQSGGQLLERGHRLKIAQEGPVGRAAAAARPIIVSDMDTDFAYSRRSVLPESRSEIAFPLIISGKIIGVLDIHSKQAHAFGEKDANVLQILADQLALAIENVRLLSDAQVITTQLEYMIAEQTKRTWKEFASERAITYQYTLTGVKPILQAEKPMDQDGLRVPLVLRGQEIGALDLRKKDKTRWSDSERDLAEKVAIQVALALENSRLLEETRRRALQEQIVNEISARLGRSLDVDTLLQTAARELGSLPDVAEVSVYVEPANQKEHRK